MTAPDPRSEVPSIEETPPPPTEPTAETGQSNGGDPLQKALADAAEMKDAWLRARAEIENVRRQCQADVARAHKYAIEKFAEDLLTVKDALEQTVTADADVPPETLKSGADLTLKAMNAAFARAQIKEINPVGERFDPHQHQAMQAVESTQPTNTVVTVFQKGYLINDRVLRPALVTVAKAPETGGANRAAG